MLLEEEEAAAEGRGGVASEHGPSAVHASELQGPAAHRSAESLASSHVR